MKRRLTRNETYGVFGLCRMEVDHDHVWVGVVVVVVVVGEQIGSWLDGNIHKNDDDYLPRETEKWVLFLLLSASLIPDATKMK